MDLIAGILWLRKLGIGRSLNAIEIVGAIDNYLFSESDLEFKRDLLIDDDGDWLLWPLLPENLPDSSREYGGVLFPFWCKGFKFGDQEEVDLTQFHAIESFVLVSEVIKHLLTPPGQDGKKYLLPARSLVRNLSPAFRMAGAYFNRALKNPDEIGTLLVEDWANNETYEFEDVSHETKILRFCEIVISIANMDEHDFHFPSDLPPWQESKDFLQEIGILDNPSWRNEFFSNKDISQMKQHVVDDVDSVLLDFESWFRVFDVDPAATDWRWCYYFWDDPYAASVWRDSGFDPFDAALWKSINYDTFDVLKVYEDDQTYKTIAPMVRAGIPVAEESIEHWGDAEDSVQILFAIDQGFPNIEEYQKYKVTGADYLTICKFLERSREQLSIQELARAIALQENGGMSIEHSIAWSKIDQSVLDVVNFSATKQSPTQASKWLDSGIQLEIAIKWHEAGFDPIPASEWIKTEFDIKEAIQWKNNFILPENAQKWKEKEISPEIAQRREQAGIRP